MLLSGGDVLYDLHLDLHRNREVDLGCGWMTIQSFYITKTVIYIMVTETPCNDLVFSVADLANNHLTQWFDASDC